MLDNVEELEENLVENALLSLLGKKHHINDLSHFCDIYNKYIRKNGYSFVLTPLKFRLILELDSLRLGGSQCSSCRFAHSVDKAAQDSGRLNLHEIYLKNV